MIRGGPAGSRRGWQPQSVLWQLEAGVGAVQAPVKLAETISKPAAASIGSSSQRNVLNSVRMCSA